MHHIYNMYQKCVTQTNWRWYKWNSRHCCCVL